MPRIRFIEYEDRAWRITELARAHHLSVGTLYGRLERFGETASGIQRSLTTGLMTRRQAGLVGASRSPWGRSGS